MRLFISYSSPESDLAERLAYGLRGEGHTVFYDRDTLPPGQSYDTRIREAVEECDLFVCLIGPASFSPGSYALTELDLARQKWDDPSGRILPVMVAETALESLPPFIRAVTVLRPRGDLVAEVLAAVSHLELPGAAVHPVTVRGSPHNAGWMLTFDIVHDSPVKEVFYRFDDELAFRSTGFGMNRDHTTGLPVPRLSVDAGRLIGQRSLFVKFTDSTGRENGPFELSLDANEQTAASAREVLEMTRSSWLHFSEHTEDRMILHFTHLLCWKNGLREVRYSVDDESLSRSLRYSPDWSGPGAPGIAADDEVMVEIPLTAKYVYLQLHFVDGIDWPAERIPVPEIAYSKEDND